MLDLIGIALLFLARPMSFTFLSMVDRIRPPPS
jgi:hypothetical protein